PRAAAAPVPAVDATLSATVGFDSNVYLAEFGRLANRESGTTGAGARLAAKFDSGVAVAYSANATKFWDEPAEDNCRQTIGASWTREPAAHAFSSNASTEFTLVDGGDQGVDYGAGIGSAFSTAAPRERRDQWQNKTDLSLRHETELGFVRAVGKLQYWDM